MANQAFSESNDQLVGAGELYFRRFDDTNGWHHLGNADEMTITTDVTTVEKESSMNHRRSLMNSATTKIKVTANLTLTEYNPYNLALGLYGVEHIEHQEAKEVTDVPIVVPSVPGIINLTDANGNRYYNVTDVKLKPSSIRPATVSFGTNGVFTDKNGGTIEVTGTYTGDTDKQYNISIKVAPTAVGSLEGMVIEWKEGFFGTPHELTFTADATETQVLEEGISLKVSLPANTNTFTVTGDKLPIMCRASSNTLMENADYMVEKQTAAIGMIKIPVNSTIKKGDTVLVSASIPDMPLITVSGGDAGTIEGEFAYTGDPNVGDIYNIQAWRCKITPDGDMGGFIGSDFGTFKIKCEFMDDAYHHPDYPLYKAVKTGISSGTTAKNGQYDPLN